ncbi:MAG: hypothetical protein JOZ69_14140, partial [Myxococcales bacterium]|nr:hypothetical protein [Myxococcales bacterium]
MTIGRRFPIRFDVWFRPLALMCLLPPAAAYVAVEGDEVKVRMAWAFRATFARSAVAHAARWSGWTPSRGVHGWAGRWLVNG